jgi:CheY-like chemotaxis protein
MANILVVDDEPGVLSFVSEVLELHGHKVQTATNGKEAAEHQSGQHLDLVVTDLVMPEKNGINMIREMRQATPDIRIIAMSGGTGFSGEIDLLEVAKLLGVSSILHKPFMPNELIDAVSKALTASQVA